MRWRSIKLGLVERVFIMVVIGLGVMLASFAVLGIQAVRDSTERTLQERRTLAEVIAGRVDDRLNESIRMVQVMIETQHLDPQLNDQATQARWVHDIRDHFGNFAYWVAIINVDRKLVVADPPDGNVRDFDFANAKCVQYVFDNLKPVISCAFLLDTPTPIVAMVIPIFKAGQINGLVFTALNLNALQFTEVLSPLGLGTTGYIEVVDSNGLILGTTRPELLWQQDDHQGQFATLIADHQTTVGMCHNCHVGNLVVTPKVEEVMAFAPLTSARWGVALRQAKSEAFTYSNALQQQVVFLGVAAFLVAALLTWFATRQLVNPLRGLTHACAEIADGNLAADIPLNGPGELGTLAHAFDFMRQQLRVSHDRIQDWATELETQVQQRTHELEESRTQLLNANHELSTLNAVGNAVRNAVDLETTLDSALEHVATFGHVWGASICLFDGTGGKFVEMPHHSIHLNGTCACRWVGVAPVIERALHDKQAYVTNVPLSLTAEDKIVPRADATMHAVVCVPLAGKSKNMGVMILINLNSHQFAASELSLLTSIGVQIGIAVENARLFDALRDKEAARTELLRKVIGAQEDERRRIARELHDETSQALTALNVGLKTAIMAPANTPDDVKQRLTPLKTQAAGVLEEIQRLIRDLRPSLLDDLGLISALDWYAETRLKSQGIQVEWELIGTERRLPREVETTLFRIAQEAISNVARHAGAENVSILLGYYPDAVTLEIEDDGQGFDITGILHSPHAMAAYGLLGMRERASLLGGELLIESQLEQGTRIQIKIPLDHTQA